MPVLSGYSNDWSPSIHFVLSIECLNSLTPTDICALSEILGYWLLVIGYWLLVIGYWLLVIGYWLLVICYWLFATNSLFAP